jgi:hypothetical protein
MGFASTMPAYDPLRTSLFGTVTLPWDMTQQATAGGDDADPRDAAAAVPGARRPRGRAAAPADRRRRAVHVGMALEGRRDDYARDPRFAWPAP